MEISDFSVEKKYCPKLGRNVILKTDHRDSDKKTCFDNGGCAGNCHNLNNENPAR